MPNLTKEQGEAFTNVLNAFNNAWSARQAQRSFEKVSSAPNYINDNTGALKKVGLEKCKTSYDKFFEALNQPVLKNYLGDEANELRSNLEKALKNGDFSKVENLFDKVSNGLDIELVKIAEVEKTNPKLTIGARANNFGRKVVSAVADLVSRERVG